MGVFESVVQVCQLVAVSQKRATHIETHKSLATQPSVVVFRMSRYGH